MSDATNSSVRESVELYSSPSPDGNKIVAALEEVRSETGDKFEYDLLPIDVRNSQNVSKEYLQINPNGKVPTIVDPNTGVTIFESGAILLYLAEKYHVLLPIDRAQRTEATSWLFWGSTGVSNQVKEFGFYFKSCPHSIPYCVSRYANEVMRLLVVLNRQLSDGRPFIVGDMYTVADIGAWPWVYALLYQFGDVEEAFGSFAEVPLVLQWCERCAARPASQKALVASATDLAT